MNDPFLEKLAEHVVEKYADSLPETCIVLPNRRSGLFFRKFLGKKAGKSIIAPLILSIEDFMFNSSGFNKAEPLTLLLELYQAYKAISKEEIRPLEQFFGMGKSILNDFNEIDLYLVDADAIFTHLSDIKAMSLWSPSDDSLTDFQKKYLGFYRSQAEIYREFNKRIESRRLAYEGKAYRVALAKYKNYLGENRIKNVVFAGLNALSKAEEQVIKELKGMGMAEVFWDTDSYYLENKDHEAGRFLRRHFGSWSSGNRNWITDGLVSDEKKVEISGIPRNVTQVKYAGEILQKLSSEDPSMDNTAVVLSDEKLLVPLLNSIPEAIGEMNITMGYPLKFTPCYSFFKAALLLHENPDGSPRSSFYSPDLLRLIRHPYFNYLFSYSEENNERKILNSGSKEIMRSNKLNYSPADLKELFPAKNEQTGEAVALLFSAWKSPAGLLEKLTHLINVLKEIFLSSNEKGRELEVEYLYHFARIVNKLSDTLPQYPDIDKIKLIRKLLLQAAETTSIPFYGEPLKGLQIMGMLETRTIDFENLIILSVNENILPSGKTYNTFIPLEIKIHYGIPTYRDKDAVYAYHFYRLLQRAKNIHIIYNTEQDEFGKGEKSRFLTQLQLELQQKNPKAALTEKVISIPPPVRPLKKEITIPKTDEIVEKIRQKAVKGFSPSSLQSYINCSLQFYFNYIAGLKEEDEIEETIQSKTLGDVVHNSLNLFYEKFRGREVDIASLDPGGVRIDEIIGQSFSEKFREGETEEGLNLLISKLARAYFRNYLRFEEKSLKEDPSLSIKVVRLEDTLSHFLEVNTGKGNETVKVGGQVDRVDIRNKRYQVIDYKTGYVEPKDLKANEPELIFEDPKYKYPFQLMVYAWAISKMENIKPENIDAGIFSLRKPSNGIMQLNLAGGLTDDSAEKFEEGLKKLIEEIFDTSAPFTQAEDPDRCKWCPYKEICNRL